MSYENCFSCSFFKSNPERCISKDLKKDCKLHKEDLYSEALKEQIRIVKLKSLKEWIRILIGSIYKEPRDTILSIREVVKKIEGVIEV